jgi:hypothetical protein
MIEYAAAGKVEENGRGQGDDVAIRTKPRADKPVRDAKL